MQQTGTAGRYGLSSDYRYGYGGKENDNEIKGEANSLDYGARIYDPRVGRWMSTDPKESDMPYESSYSAMGNNPIYFIDPDGQVPTPAEAARMAAHVYGDKKNNILIGGWRVSKTNFGVKLKNPNGLKSLVYERVVNGEVTEYTYATAGTEEYEDWIGNITQPVGLSDQYHSSVENAKKISEGVGKKELSFVGHSLGGGQAALNSLVVGGKAITFNAAGVSDITKVVEGNIFTPFLTESNITAFVLATDPLNFVQNRHILMPDVNGFKITLPPTDFSSIYNGHSVNSMLKNFGVNPDEYKKEEKKYTVF